MSDIDEMLISFDRRQTASDTAIAEAEQQAGAKFPEDYVHFLKVSNGGEGFIGGAYTMLWSVEELASTNQSYAFAKYVPGLLAIGSDGGGEAFAFDTRVAQWPIVQVPFVGMHWDLAEPIGASFGAFLRRLYETEPHPAGRLEARWHGKQLFEVHPVILDGSPTDLANKVLLNRQDHIQSVAYWNRIISELRAQSGSNGQ